MSVQFISAMRLAPRSKQMNEKLTESVPRRDSENLFVNFTKEHSAIHTGKQNGAS